MWSNISNASTVSETSQTTDPVNYLLILKEFVWYQCFFYKHTVDCIEQSDHVFSNFHLKNIYTILN